MKRALLIVALCATSTQVPASAIPAPTPQETGVYSRDDGRGTDYVVSKTDNICGLDNPKQLTRPAKVNYSKLLKATPEMQTMKRERIKSDSPRGINLRTEAENRIRKACEKIRGQKSYCSVWKRITRRDAKAISDITKEVLSQL